MKFWHDMTEAERKVEIFWNGFRRFWRDVAVAAVGRLHLISNEGHDESETWCGAATYGDCSDSTRLITETTCRACLLSVASVAMYGADAEGRLLELGPFVADLRCEYPGHNGTARIS